MEACFTFNRTAYGIEILIRRLSHFRTLPFNRTAYGIEIVFQIKHNLSFPAFNRTAYGIEIDRKMYEHADNEILLIAPLMELKYSSRDGSGLTHMPFNRTAYGIEILKVHQEYIATLSFNRTAYGIEMRFLRR